VAEIGDRLDLLAANTHPDHDTLCAFRKQFLMEIDRLFVQVLCIAKEMKLLQLGTVALDGEPRSTPMPRAIALCRNGHTEKLEAQLRLKVADPLARAAERFAREQADHEAKGEGAVRARGAYGS
jgi:hypothetical protein